MAIFLSKNKEEPYYKITEVNSLISNITISNVIGIDSKTEIYDIYLIIENEKYDKIRISVENEDNDRAGFWISEIDAEGDAKQWQKEIILDINTDNIRNIIPLKIKWAVMDNIYLVDNLSANAILNIYSVDTDFSE